MIGLWGAGGAVGTMVGGVLADRWGRRPTLLTAHLGAAGADARRSASPASYWMIAGAALLLGSFAEAARPAFSAMMVDVVPRPRPAARVLAQLLGDQPGLRLRGRSSPASPPRPTTCCCSSSTRPPRWSPRLIIFVKVRETRPAAAATTASAPRRRRGRLAYGPRATGCSSASSRCNLFIALVFLQHISMLPIAMGDDGLSPATFGTVIALNGVLIVAGPALRAPADPGPEPLARAGAGVA